MLELSERLYLMPGDYVFGCSSNNVHTLLGSCVAITLWHPVRKIGAMCHFLLPSRGKDFKDELSGRYGDEAIQLFLMEMARYGCQPHEFEVSVVGAGTMTQTASHSCKSIGSLTASCSNQCRNVACKNREAAFKLLKMYGFNVRFVDVGGTHFRQVALDVKTGTVSINGESISDIEYQACVGE